MKERVTVLLGAGAMIEATDISTKSLTEKVINKCKKYKINKTSSDSVVDVICNKFLSLYSKEISTLTKRLTRIEQITSILSFEDIFHVLELLYNYRKTNAYKGFLSAYNVFTEINQEFQNLDTVNVYCSAHEIINSINDEIYDYDSQFELKGKSFKKFFDDMENAGKYTFDVFNLNYDTWVEQSFVNYNDGYIDVLGYEDRMQRFDINEFLKKSDKHTISHLHGQIYFGYPKFENADINKFAFQEPSNTLYKYIDYEFVKNYRLNSGRSNDYTQSGEGLFRTNIVTGLMKTDKLLWNPLTVYHNKFMDSLFKNEILVLVGYGFSDLYINNLLFQYNACHFKNRKVLIIDYISDCDWCPAVEHPFTPSEKALFTNLIYKDDFWCLRHPFEPKEEIIISPDKMVYISTNGFQNFCRENLLQKVEFLH